MKTILHCSLSAFESIRNHVLQNEDEQAAFIFLEWVQTNGILNLNVKDHYLVQRHELVGDNSLHIDISDETLSRVIQKAAKENLALGEVHSHPFVKRNVRFSWSDMAGFEEFVPHVSWRLRQKPYVALVFGRNDFDALAWSSDPVAPVQLDSITIDRNTVLKPTNRTLKTNRKYQDDRNKIFETRSSDR